MARPREFDPEVALKGATEIFWRQGFRATSLPDLLTAMGLTRGSFYKAFGDKHSVYLLSLDYYDRMVMGDVLAELEKDKGGDAWQALMPLFSAPAPDRRGCYICNAMVELGPEMPDVAQKANAMATRLRDAIEAVLERHSKGQPDQQLRQTADLILSLYFGNQAIGKAGGTPLEWQERLRSLLKMPARV